jgi:hypothetical protein
MQPFYIYYALLCAAIVVLFVDIAGASMATPRVARLRRLLGIAFASGPGIAPVIAGFGPWELYGVAFALFTIGSLEVGYPFPARWTRRLGYGLMLSVGFLPSWSLIMLAPLVAFASIGLVEPRSAAANHASG